MYVCIYIYMYILYVYICMYIYIYTFFLFHDEVVFLWQSIKNDLHWFDPTGLSNPKARLAGLMPR